MNTKQPFYIKVLKVNRKAIWGRCHSYSVLPGPAVTKELNFRTAKTSVAEIIDVRELKPALKVHKNENFFGSDFEFCTISLFVILKY
jgi:hypothetical protein